MKKVITLLAMTIVLGTISFAQSNGQNQALGKARGAAKDCLKGYQNIKSSVTDNFICNDIGNVGNMNRTIFFYSEPPCPGNDPCPYRIAALATVVIGCDGNVESVTCFPLTQ